jgi:serine/threonine-protein kinase HipA
VKIKTDQRIKQIHIKVAGQVAGLLEKNVRFEFTYHSDAALPVSAPMQLETRHYNSDAIFPIFEMNIPEGYIRYRITKRLRKYIQVDEMLFLALQGNSGIGCIGYEAQGIEQEDPSAENLTEILNWSGDESLFEELVNKYLLQSTISGIQPKVIVPEKHGDAEKGSIILPSLIVKSGDDEFPQLAINEFICMQLAKACHIPTPEFWLSDNQQLFVMRRFDLRSNGHCLGMEDMAVLQGKSTNDKYQSSYENISKAINYYSEVPKADNELLFKMVVHSCMVGNGDGHLKNFALLYEDIDFMRLSPLYDVVNTQIYNPKDTLALNLGGSKAFPDRRRLVDFSKLIGVKNGEEIIDEMAEQIRNAVEGLKDYIELMDADIESVILENLHRSTTRSAIRQRPARRHTKHT